MSMMDRIKKVGPELRELVKQHEDDTFKGGVEALNHLMTTKIQEAHLMDFEVKHVSKVGVHPDNREKAMLIPIDVHDLLLKFAENGYNPLLWDALALRIPFGPEGDAWRAANVELVDDSDNQLAPVHGDSIEIVTGRGSHGSGALRLAHYGALSIHEELADATGNVSKAKFLEMQPSWEEPLEKGVSYKILPGELELEVPGLLACLSRIGNASHDVYREQTTLQMCARVHSLIASKIDKGQPIDSNLVAKQACVGNGGAASLTKAVQLTSFVEAWSGGRHGKVLRELEKFETSCRIKRKLAPADLAALADADLLHAPRYIQVT